MGNEKIKECIFVILLIFFCAITFITIVTWTNKNYDIADNKEFKYEYEISSDYIVYINSNFSSPRYCFRSKEIDLLTMSELDDNLCEHFGGCKKD